jgi:hypothetical protein
MQYKFLHAFIYYKEQILFEKNNTKQTYTV